MNDSIATNRNTIRAVHHSFHAVRRYPGSLNPNPKKILDVFSFGLSLLECYVGTPDYSKIINKLFDRSSSLRQILRNETYHHIPKRIKRLILDMVTFSEELGPISLEEALKTLEEEYGF